MLEAVSFTDVEIRDRFWSPRQETNRSITAWHCLDMLKQAGNLHNFQLAASGARDGYRGPRYMDSDLYKTIEGLSYSLATHPDPVLEARLDELIALIESAQMPDGYLNTFYQVNKPDQRWSNLRDDHELYCAGHLIEAAVAHAKSLPPEGRERETSGLLDVALRFCEHIWQVFGPDGKAAYPGHPEIEIALFKLWRLTGDQRWLDLAKRFLDNRGNGYFAREHGQTMKDYQGDYFVDSVPIDELVRGTGHAVRFCYLMSGAAEVAEETRDQQRLEMLRRTWQHVTEGQMYITGGVGSNPATEGFADDYDLPNAAGYQETCASISMAMWGQRMSHVFAEGRYYDAVEAALYNAVASGVGLDGKSFFYENPLENDGLHRRQPWFECACCPPNILRTLACIADYIYAKSPGALYVNLYVSGSVRTEIDGKEFAMNIESVYPEGGSTSITIQSNAKLALHLRLPGWCRSFTLLLNGEEVTPAFSNGYAVLNQKWKPGNHIRLLLDMPPELVSSDPNVVENAAKRAIRCGPLIYCAEETRSFGPSSVLCHPKRLDDFDLSAYYSPSEIGRLVVDWKDYTFVPYAAWGNREPVPMKVWLPI